MIKKIKRVKKKKVKRKLKANKQVASKNKKKKAGKEQGNNSGPASEKPNLPGRDEKNRWLPGHCPNKGGRPKGSLSLTTILRKILLEPKSKKSKVTKGEDLMKVLLKHAKKGSPKLLDIILNRLDGKVPDRVINTETNPLSEIDEAKLNEIISRGKDQDDPE